MRISDWSSDVCSSDLAAARAAHFQRYYRQAGRFLERQPDHLLRGSALFGPAAAGRRRKSRRPRRRSTLKVGVNVRLGLGAGMRSEEHTSELQSLMRISYAVFCLQKKKNQRYNM